MAPVSKTKMNLEYNGINSAVSNYLYSDLATKKDIKDENGIIDGNTLTDEERAKIKKLQNAKYKNDAIPETSDRQLLTNVHQSDELYSRAFYNHLKSEGLYNTIKNSTSIDETTIYFLTKFEKPKV